MGGYLDAVIPLIMHFVELKEESGDDELKESCLQAFEALALRCFREITPYIKEVWHHVLREGGGCYVERGLLLFITSYVDC